MAPARTATKTDGPQEIREYTYPPGVPEDGWDVVSRHGRFMPMDPPPDPGARPVPNVLRVFEQIDGNGPLPVEDRPNTIEFRMGGIVQDNAGATVYFRRSPGSTGAYALFNVLLDGPPQTRLPVSRAQ